MEIAGALEFIDKFRDQGQGGSVFDGNFIEGAIVLDRSEASSFLGDKEKWASHGGF